MASRRDFMRGGLAPAAVAASIGAVGFARSAPPSTWTTPALAIVDDALAASSGLAPFEHGSRAARDTAFAWLIAPLDHPRLRDVVRVASHSNRSL